MQRNRNCILIVIGFSLVLLFGSIGFIYSGQVSQQTPKDGPRLPLILAYKAKAQALERPEVSFDHDMHTTALKQTKKDDCKVCHVIEEKDANLVVSRRVRVYKFPKEPVDWTDKTAIMEAFHAQCGDCHRKRTREGKKSGPDIGQCGECHVRNAKIKKVQWAWSPMFNYERHYRHADKAEKVKAVQDMKIAGAVKVVINAESDQNTQWVDKQCQTCHHHYKEKLKELIYTKDSANSCRACHKAKDEKNARSMKNVAHAACIGCHMKLSEEGKKLSKKETGPFECKGCHGEHKVLTVEEIKKVPRLERGQKDFMDLFLVDPKKAPKLVTMKEVPFDHKIHEPTAQFCSVCHHYSLEKCVNCHPMKGDLKKGGGVTYEMAYHLVSAKQACLGCHNESKQEKKCAACHHWCPERVPQLCRQRKTCQVCHRGASQGKPWETPPIPLVFDKEKVPEKVEIKEVANQYKPAEMPHQKIVKNLTTVSNKDSLARTFHAAWGDEALCAACHHETETKAAKRFPKCIACHGLPFAPNEPGRPGIVAAFHRQCMGCHKILGQKPLPLQCAKCHPEKEGKEKVKTKIPERGAWR